MTVHNKKLTQWKVTQIRALVRMGFRQDLIARKYGISQPTVSQIHRGHVWVHKAPTEGVAA